MMKIHFTNYAPPDFQMSLNAIEYGGILGEKYQAGFNLFSMF